MKCKWQYEKYEKYTVLYEKYNFIWKLLFKVTPHSFLKSGKHMFLAQILVHW